MSAIWDWGMGRAEVGWEGRGGNSTGLDFYDSESMFNTGPNVFQRGFSSADAKGGLLMLLQRMFLKTAGNGALSLSQSRS